MLRKCPNIISILVLDFIKTKEYDSKFPQDSADAQVLSIENGSGIQIEGNGWKSIETGDY